MPKISELPAANPASGAELLSTVQGGVTKKMTVDQILARAGAGSAPRRVTFDQDGTAGQTITFDQT